MLKQRTALFLAVPTTGIVILGTSASILDFHDGNRRPRRNHDVQLLPHRC